MLAVRAGKYSFDVSASEVLAQSRAVLAALAAVALACAYARLALPAMVAGACGAALFGADMLLRQGGIAGGRRAAVLALALAWALAAALNAHAVYDPVAQHAEHACAWQRDCRVLTKKTQKQRAECTRHEDTCELFWRDVQRAFSDAGAQRLLLGFRVSDVYYEIKDAHVGASYAFFVILAGCVLCAWAAVAAYMAYRRYL